MNTSKFIFTTVFLTVVWIIFTWSLHPQILITGIFISALIAVFTSDYLIKDPGKILNPKRWLFAITYVMLFIRELIKANFDVAWRVLHPDMPTNPGIVKIKTNLKSDLALTALSNSITLTPGTLTLDIDKKQGELMIHWMTMSTSDRDEAEDLIKREFEEKLKEIFE
ncbi:MAG: Na+/H+ antiporter subunit E [Methanobacterium sp.]|jgi:multicomponent Na+:H+ antiporter subunit E